MRESMRGLSMLCLGVLTVVSACRGSSQQPIAAARALEDVRTSSTVWAVDLIRTLPGAQRVRECYQCSIPVLPDEGRAGAT